MKKSKILILLLVIGLSVVFGFIFSHNPIKDTASHSPKKDNDSEIIISTLPNLTLIDSNRTSGEIVHTYTNGDFEFKSSKEKVIGIEDYPVDSEITTDYLTNLFLYNKEEINKIAKKYDIILLDYHDYIVDGLHFSEEEESLYLWDFLYLSDAGRKLASSKHFNLYNELTKNPEKLVILYHLGDYKNTYPNLAFHAYLNNYSQCDSVYNFIYDFYLLSEKYFPIKDDENVDFTVKDSWCDIDIYLTSLRYKETLSKSDLGILQPGKDITNLPLSFNRSTLNYLKDEKDAIIKEFQYKYIDKIHQNELLGDSYMPYNEASTYPSLVLTEDDVYINGENPNYNIFEEFKYDISSEEYKYEIGFYDLTINVPHFERFFDWIYPNEESIWITDTHFRYTINDDVYDIKAELVSEERQPYPGYTKGLYFYNIYFYKNDKPLELSVNTLNTPIFFDVSLDDICLLFDLEIEKIEPDAVYLKSACPIITTPNETSSEVINTIPKNTEEYWGDAPPWG